MRTFYLVRPISDRTAFTGKSRPSPFQSSYSATEELLSRELGALRARNVVLEVDVAENQLRIDGTMMANASVHSPAVRLAFESEHGPLTYATDRFTTWQDNVRAIALGLEALRKVDRYGISSRGEQYTGFKAIGGGAATAMPAPEAVSLDEAWSIIGSYGDGPVAEQRARFEASGDVVGGYDVHRALRRALAANHPDRRDGDQTLWNKVEQAARVIGIVR